MHPPRAVATALALAAALAAPASGSAPPPLPSAQLLAWTQREIGAMISFDMITELTSVGNSQHFCIDVGGDRGFALPPATAYAPSQLSTDSWLDAAVAMGAKYSVLVAMHCSGFAQWATDVSGANGTGGFNYTYSTRYSGGAAVDVVASYMESSASHGVLPGFYYSLNENYFLNVGSGRVQPASTLTPGQANVSQETYIAIAVAQQVELWKKYAGQLSEVWVRVAAPATERRSPPLPPPPPPPPPGPRRSASDPTTRFLPPFLHPAPV